MKTSLCVCSWSDTLMWWGRRCQLWSWFYWSQIFKCFILKMMLNYSFLNYWKDKIVKKFSKQEMSSSSSWLFSPGGKILNWHESQSLYVTAASGWVLVHWFHTSVCPRLCSQSGLCYQVWTVTSHQGWCFPSTYKSPLLLHGLPRTLFIQAAIVPFQRRTLRRRCVQT